MSYIKFAPKLIFILLIFTLNQGCNPTYSYKEEAVPESVPLSQRLNRLFSETKLFCFGRYAIEVPRSAELIWGNTSLSFQVDTFSGNFDHMRTRVEKDISDLEKQDSTLEITHNHPGPIMKSWQLRYFPSEEAKIVGLYFFDTYINKGEVNFILGSSLEGEGKDAAAAREAVRARSLRLRAPDEAPSEPGYCIQHAFISSSSYNKQEIVNVGIHIPSLPDFTFSISSNKDAYLDYRKERFEEMRHTELSLLARIRNAKRDQGLFYPSRTVLREGKRNVQHWQGEESLIRRKNGTHDFEWALVGTPGDVANPSDFGVSMYTKVAHNLVGAAREASLTDDEAVAMWDRLLSGLKFRVKVPGAPPGSYYLPRSDTNTPPASP